VLFGFAVQSARRFVDLAVVFLAVAILGWAWQPAGVTWLAVVTCVLVSVAAATARTPRAAAWTAVIACGVALAYALAATPAKATYVPFVAVFAVLVLVLAISRRPQADRNALKFVVASALPFLLAAQIAGYPFREEGRVSDRIPLGAAPQDRPEDLFSKPGFGSDLPLRYTPILVFTGDEKWRPVGVDDFIVTGAGYDRRTGEEIPLLGGYDPSRYRLEGCSARKPCYEIRNPCYPKRSRGASCQNQGPSADRLRFDLYRRVLSRVEYPRKFAGPLPFDDLEYVLQYWMFYPYDRWLSPEGLIVQEHAGDWEAISVGLSRDRPLFVAYSSHCGGVWRHWRDAHAVALSLNSFAIDWSRAGTHPVAWVAEGSHAMYPTDGDAIPKWSDCTALDRVPGLAWLTRVLFSGSARETISHQLKQSARDGTIQLAARYHVLLFPGVWGPEDRTAVARVPAHRGNGPPSPACQPLWIDPIWTIFCDPHWDGPEDRCNGKERVRSPNPCNGSFPTSGPDVPHPG
jgi:hypothetical protein